MPGLLLCEPWQPLWALGFLFATQKSGGKRLDQATCTANCSDHLAFPFACTGRTDKKVSPWVKQVKPHTREKQASCSHLYLLPVSDIHHTVSPRACGSSQHLRTQQHPHPHTAQLDRVPLPACYLKNPEKQGRGGGGSRVHRHGLPGVGKDGVATSPAHPGLPALAHACRAHGWVFSLLALLRHPPHKAGRERQPPVWGVPGQRGGAAAGGGGKSRAGGAGRG